MHRCRSVHGFRDRLVRSQGLCYRPGLMLERPLDRLVQVLCRSRPGREPFSRAKGSQLSGCRIRIDHRNADAGVLAKVQSGLVQGQARSRAQRSSWFPWAPQSKQRKSPLVSSTEKQRGLDARRHEMGMRHGAGGHGGRWDDSQSGRARAPSESGCARLGNRSTSFLIRSGRSPLGCRSVRRLLGRLTRGGLDRTCPETCE